MESTPAQEFYQARTTEVQSCYIRRCEHEGQEYPTRCCMPCLPCDPLSGVCSVCGRMLVVFLLGFGCPQYLCDLQIYSVHAG